MRKKMYFPRMLALVLAAALVLSLFSGCGKQAEAAEEVMGITTGIDVARYQGTIDWKEVSRSDIQFAMIRVGYRSMKDGAINEDANARYNLQEAAKYDIPIGVYFFSTAISEEEAKEEAAWTADLISGYPITYPVAYDCENFNDPESRQYNMTRGERTTVALTFMKTMESLGYQSMFYGSKNDLQFENAWETSRIEGNYKIWVAQYPEIPYPETAQSSYVGEHHMWQYSKQGTVPGISQPVDLNVAYFGYDGITPRRDKKAPEEVEADVEAMMTFEDVNERVTAIDETNLRDIPSLGEDSTVMAVLTKGEIAQRIAVSASGWSKVVYEGNTYYAYSTYLINLDEPAVVEETTPPTSVSEDGFAIKTQFEPMEDKVTAKEKTNLRNIPSVDNPNSEVKATIYNGDVVLRTGINEDLGWSRVEYEGRTLYCLSSLLTAAE